MQSRCCWPPERDRPGLIELVLHLVPERHLPQRRSRPARRDPSPGVPLSLWPARTFSRIDMVGNGLGFWNTMPTRRRSRTGSTAAIVDVRRRRA